jgi:hypothetical protein
MKTRENYWVVNLCREAVAGGDVVRDAGRVGMLRIRVLAKKLGVIGIEAARPVQRRRTPCVH